MTIAQHDWSAREQAASRCQPANVPRGPPAGPLGHTEMQLVWRGQLIGAVVGFRRIGTYREDATARKACPNRAEQIGESDARDWTATPHRRFRIEIVAEQVAARCTTPGPIRAASSGAATSTASGKSHSWNVKSTASTSERGLPDASQVRDSNTPSLVAVIAAGPRLKAREFQEVQGNSCRSQRLPFCRVFAIRPRCMSDLPAAQVGGPNVGLL
jgi:hypothetical protein